MKIFICDDEIQIAREIEGTILRTFPENSITIFTQGEELLKQLEKETCEVLLLDIDMPGLSGLDVAKRLGELEIKPLLVFVTGHDELVYDSFRYHPFGFVRKTYFEQEIEKVLRDCMEELESSTRHFSFRANGNTIRIRMMDIAFFEADGNYLKLSAKEGEFRMRSTISAMENSLSTYGFIRVHKGFLVNQEAIRIFGAEDVELESGVRLPLGKTYAETAKQRFMRYLR